MQKGLYPMTLRTLFTLLMTLCLPILAATTSSAGTYPKLEASFELPDISGNPFDYIQNDVQVTFKRPDDKTDAVPAFFDGGATWRVRYTPQLPGRYVIAQVTRNGVKAAPKGLNPGAFTVTGVPGAGFIRRDPAHPTCFAFDNGAVYYPLGNDAAWRSGPGEDVPDLLAKMGAAGENWARVWMCHWDGKNLDWPAVPGNLAALNLTVARHWDAIVEAAEQNGIYLQITLQHHGQYSTQVDPNWNENPWNQRNGGFLATPEAFFTDTHARALTRAKFRYILARWGYSSHVMAWELFNEVEGTDAIHKGKDAEVTAWHREMAAFLRAQDTNHHLVTTSSDLKIPGLYDGMDYIQPHSYSPDPLSAILALKPATFDRPAFYGEIGPSGNSRSDKDFLNTVLWSSLMSESSGTAQYWFWDRMAAQHLYDSYRSITGFLKASKLIGKSELQTARLPVTTEEGGALSFGPGGGWETAAKTDYLVTPSGEVEGIGSMPAYFQGKAHHEMFPNLGFQVDYLKAGEFRVAVRQIARSGAHLILKVDGQPVAEHTFPAGNQDQNVNAVLTAPVPAGKHRVTIENDGADWVVLSRFTLTPYGSALKALGKGDANHAAFWIYRSSPTESTEGTVGQMTLPALSPGIYTLAWWDVDTGKEIATEPLIVREGEPTVVKLRPVKTTLAGYVIRSAWR